MRFSFRRWRWLLASYMQGARRRQRKTPHFDSRPAEVELLEPRQMLTVTFHGGELLTNVDAQAVYLGNEWQNNPALNSQTTQLDQFVNTLVTGQYMDMLTNAGYGVGRGTSVSGAIDNLALNTSTGITDAQIRQDIQSMITAGQLKSPTANNLYIIYVEQGVVIQNGNTSSATTFLGYHGAFAGQAADGTSADIHYAVIAYPGGPNPSSASQRFASVFNELTSVSSHEVAEAVTDPNVNYKSLGWYDYQRNGEIGDLTRLNTIWNGYEVQDVVNQSDQPISPTGGTTTLVGPQNVVVTALSSTTVAVSWNAVTGAQGYRILELQGSQWITVATLGSSVKGTAITGLTDGSTIAFKVEAYNGTNSADSQSVSVTLPANTTLTSPSNVVATATTSTSAQVNWTAAAGAQGYRVYVQQGSQWVLVGTVGASANSASINGLTPGATVLIRVEAYNGSSVADSQSISLTLPSTSSNTLTVSVTILSQTSIQLTWNAIPGSQGYRVFYSDGTYKYYLGSVRGNTTAVTIVGLAPGSNYNFQIEAFHGFQVLQDSNWVSVNTASASPFSNKLDEALW